MSHNFESGFFVRQPAWHGLGAVIDEYPGSWDEARKLAGLDWEPVTEPVYTLDGMGEGGHPIYAEVEGYKRIARSDTHDTLSVAKNSYELITHADMGEIVEAVLDQPNVKWETAGVLDGGKAVWCLAYLDEPITIAGDNTLTYPYLTVLNRHDGGAACRVQSTAIRVVCANTFKMAELEGNSSGAFYSFRHTSGWRDRVEDARAAVTGARREFARYVEIADELMGIRITKGQTDAFIRAFIPSPPETIISPRVQSNIDAARQAIRDILGSETTAHVAHTGYGLVQAAGEYLDHVRTARTAESKFGRSLLYSEGAKGNAVRIVKELAKA
jgi:phage/plasmid-like protein (TIGR03299 family)